MSQNFRLLVLWFGSEGVLKILRKSMTLLNNQSFNEKGVCTTALAAPGLLNIYIVLNFSNITFETGPIRKKEDKKIVRF